MSYTFKYYPDPGITYDIIRMLYVKLNASSIWKETLTTIDYQEEHVRFIEEHANLLPEPDPDLSLFFYIPTNKKTTFLSTVADELICKNFQTYSIEDLIKYTNNITKVKEEIFNYYFSDKILGSADFEYQVRSSRTIPDRIKLLLFGFSYNPAEYITKLNNVIQNYYELIGTYWKIDLISNDVLNQFTAKLISKPAVTKKHIDLTFVAYSLCRCTPMHLLFGYSQENLFFISTSNTLIENIRSDLAFSTSELLQTLHSIDDQYRLEIIKLLKNTPEQSPNDIADRLKLSLTATKYHLSILKKAKMITFSRNNRSTYYSYNPEGYKSLIAALEYFEKGGLEK